MSSISKKHYPVLSYLLKPKEKFALHETVWN